MIYGEKFLNEKTSIEDKKEDYAHFIELGKKLIKTLFKELDEYTSYYKRVYELEKTIDEKNYKQVIDKIYKMSQDSTKVIGSKYKWDKDYHEFYDIYNKYRGIFKNFKFMFNEPENTQNKNYFKSELDKVKNISKKSVDLMKDAVKEANDKKKKYKDIMNYNPYQKEVDDDELQFNATAEIMGQLYHETLQSTESTIRHIINDTMKALGEKVDAFND